jgi:hypothetical protein
MRKLLLAIIILFSSSEIVSANFTDYFFPVAVGSGFGYWGSFNISNVQSADGVYNTVNCYPTADCYHSLKFDLSSLPDNIDVSYVEVQRRGRMRYDTGNANGRLYAEVLASDSASLVDKLTASSSAQPGWFANNQWTTASSNWSDNPPSDYSVTQYFAMRGGFNKDNFTVVLIADTQGSQSNLIDVDEIKVRFNYTDAKPKITSIIPTIDAEEQQIRLDIQGDTATWSAKMSCDIKIFEYCTRTGYASYNTETPIAHIILENPSPNVTIEEGQGYYKGMYWGQDERTTYEAKGVVVPFHNGFSCQYTSQTLCTERELICTDLGCYYGDTTVHTDDINTYQTTIEHNPIITAPPVTDPIQWLIYKLNEMWSNYFNPKFDWSILEIEQLKDNMVHKVPFAYFYAVSEINLSPVTEEDTFTVTVPVFMEPGEATMIVASMPEELKPIFDIFKNFLRIILWGTFVVFMYNTARRIMT